MHPRLCHCFVGLLAAFLSSATGQAAPRALPEGVLPADSRLGELTTLNDYHPFRPVASAADWEIRREEIVRRVQVGAGLWPMPEKTPLNAVIHGAIDMGDYTVEKVYFESLPGHLVTGNLYRPKGKKPGPEGYPGVLCPHGHWANSRFYDLEASGGEKAVKELLAIGAERFWNGARNHIQARCVQLARMGCVVFHYDMIGYSDSLQFPEHREGPRDKMNDPGWGKWGLVSPRAGAWLQTHFGLQTWNSERSLDFLLEQPEVDKDRILVTGASGGATQTMMLTAIDSRVDAAFPAVMTSTAMQGGCTCENTFYLRIGQGNVDIAATTAPRPLGITSADDWTIELEEKGYPDLFNLFAMVGAKNHFEAHFNTQFKHNYNYVSREQMYQFVNQHFGLGLEEPVLESDFEYLGEEQLTVFDEAHPRPSGDQTGDAHERHVCEWWAADARKQIAPLLAPEDAETLVKARDVLGGAVSVMIGRTVPLAADVSFDLSEKEEKPGYTLLTGLVRNDKHGEEIPAAFAHPANWSGQVVLWIFPEGKAGMFEGGGALIPAVQKLVDQGVAVMGADLLYQGEFLNPGEEVTENRRVSYPGSADKPGQSWRASSVYRYGYNDAVFAQRVHDILTCISFVRNHEKWDVKRLSVVGLEGAGHWVAAARAVAGSDIDRAAIRTEDFRFANLSSDWDIDFLPGAVKYGDVAGFLVLSAPDSLWLADNDETLRSHLTATYQTAGSPDALHFYGGTPGDLTQSVVDYLTK